MPLYVTSTTEARMKICINKIVQALFLLLSFLENAFSKPLEKEVVKMLLNSQSDTSLQQAKQFIGSSVIGALMWPILLTLTFTAIVARVPDTLQRLLGGGGSYRHTIFQRKISPGSEEYFDRIMNSLLTSIDAIESYNSETSFHKREK